MKNNIALFLFFKLMFCGSSFAVTSDSAGMQEVVATFSELGHYFEATLKLYAALGVFAQKNESIASEVICKNCLKRSLPCDELIVKVQAKVMDQSIGAKDSIAIQLRQRMLEVYDEMTRLLCSGSLDSIREFMVKLAFQYEIPCEECESVCW